MNHSDSKQSREGHTVALLSAKGGVGLSTLALEWGRAWAAEGRHALLLELAGGDLSWHAGTLPTAFTDQVADGKTTAEDAAVTVAPNLDLIASGNAWAIHGPNNPSQVKTLFTALKAGPWTDWVIDVGNARLDTASPLIEACATVGVVVLDDIACVSRTYALLRRLAELGVSDRIALIFNRLNEAEQAESLRNRLDHITRTFLGATWPLIGVVPEAGTERRSAAVSAWATSLSSSEQENEPHISQSIMNPAPVADNRG